MQLRYGLPAELVVARGMPHDDLLAHFPYLGPPNPATARPAGPAAGSCLGPL